MGWFLRSSKPGRRRIGRKKKDTAAGRRWRWPTRPNRFILRAGLWVVLAGVVTAAWAWGVPFLRAEVAERRAAPPRVDIDPLPAWMAEPLTEQLRAAAAAPLVDNPFDHLALREAAADLQASPWVQQVRRVVRRPDGSVRVHADYRQPVALVEARDGYHLLDRSGVRLPLVYGPHEVERLGLAVIRGVAHAPPRAGEAWSGGDVRAGLRLALLVAAQPWAAQVRAIDVSNYAGRRFRHVPHLKLLAGWDPQTPLADQPGVRWGRAPGDERFYEPDAAVKLGHIQRVHRRFGTIDAGGRIVDVHGDEVLIQPAPTAEADAAGQPIGYTRGRG